MRNVWFNRDDGPFNLAHAAQLGVFSVGVIVAALAGIHLSFLATMILMTSGALVPDPLSLSIR